ncbi:MAG: DNA/RNA nuclease SfsA [Candidatus Obscuribacterales bacterium]|nr:DNA/RNA nuclease SfsA [Candidatus Obscuribacterales bacterium]
MISETLEPAVLIRRYKRFLADVEFPSGETATIHCPNPGSMIGIAEPGTPVWLRPAKEGRKLSHTWVVSELPDAYVCVDTLMANRLLFNELKRGSFADILSYANIGKEKTFGDSRFDFFLAQSTAADAKDCYMEVKSTTLAIEQTAMFPDAVTARGLRHLGGLVEAARQGFRAVQFFCLARQDVLDFRPADHIDPAYGKGLRQASERSVELVAWTMKIERNSGLFTFAAGSQVPIVLS